MNSQVDETYYDGLHEECGVFGVYDLDGGDVASTIYYGLFALRAQRSGKLWYCGQRYKRTERKSIVFKRHGTCQ